MIKILFEYKSAWEIHAYIHQFSITIPIILYFPDKPDFPPPLHIFISPPTSLFLFLIMSVSYQMTQKRV